ncbi:MAG: PorV/PorQ family protein [Candidatus Hydrogenedentota bacterium]
MRNKKQETRSKKQEKNHKQCFKRNGIYFLIIILLLLNNEVFANKTTGAAFLTISPSSAGIGRGSGTAYGTSVFDIFYNPALVNNLSNHSFGFTHIELLSNANYEYLGYVAELDYGFRIGADFTFVNNSDIKRDATGREAGKIHNRDYAGGLILGKYLNDYVSIGTKLKYIKQQLDTYKDNTWGLDAGLVFRDIIIDNFNIGLSVTNLGGEIKFIRLADELPLSYNAGINYNVFENRLRFFADVNKPDEEEVEGGVGLEYQPVSFLVFRTGFKIYEDIKTENSFRAGLGIQHKNWFFDYAYEYFSDLGTTHRLSYGVTFGKKFEVEKIEKTRETKLYKKSYLIESVNNLSFDTEIDWLKDGIREIVKHNLKKYNWGFTLLETADIFINIDYKKVRDDNIIIQLNYYTAEDPRYKLFEFEVNLKHLFDDMGSGINKFVDLVSNQ